MSEERGVADEALLGRLGVEVWRLQMRAAAGNLDRVRDSVARLVEALGDLGVDIQDPAGQPFADGSTAEIIGHNGSPAEGEMLIVTETIRPAVFISGRLAVTPQVILGTEKERDHGPDAHD